MLDVTEVSITSPENKVHDRSELETVVRGLSTNLCEELHADLSEL